MIPNNNNNNLLCLECGKHKIAFECIYCQNGFCKQCLQEHECDASKALLESQYMQPQPLIKLPSLPPTPEINKIPIHFKELQCKNYEICQKNRISNSKYCGLECEIATYIYECQKTHKYDQFRNKIEEIINSYSSAMDIDRDSSIMFISKLQQVHATEKLIHVKDARLINLSILAYPPFMQGCHRWLIQIEIKTQLFLKIGRPPSPIMNLGLVFSQLDSYDIIVIKRGVQYGVKCKGQNLVEVLLDMGQGTLAYKINNVDYGVAFKDEKLKVGPIYPALSTTCEAQISYCFKKN